MSMLLAGQVLGATWNPKVTLTNSNNAWAYGLTTVGTSTAVVVYTNNGRVNVRRSTNSGASWGPSVNFGSGDFPAVASAGSTVDVVWTQSGNFGQDAWLRYGRSANGGSSFGSSTLLASVNDPGSGAQIIAGVAHGPAGLVAVVWHELPSDLVRIRISTDGGNSFGSAQTLATISSSYVRPPMVAIGKGVVYVAYLVNDTNIEFRRSLDRGTSWSLANQLASDASYGDNIYALSLTASGSKAYLAYAAESGPSRWVRYRATADKGNTWTPAADLSSPSGFPSYKPVISLKGNVMRAVFQQCGNNSCTNSTVSYRQSGANWGTMETVSPSGPSWAEPAGVGFAGRIIVLYDAEHGTNPYLADSDVYVRTR
jgi:hypothetical protein